MGGKALVEWLREKDWANFARGYNGAEYHQNKYDLKLQQAYHTFTH